MNRLVTVFAIVFGCSLLGGCGDVESKASHFEHDHDVALHWPSDLPDLAGKIRERVHAKPATADEASGRRSELADLVAWTAEIAADTQLSEDEWKVLDKAADSLVVEMQSTKGKLTPEIGGRLLQLCELIDQAALRLTQTPVTKESSR